MHTVLYFKQKCKQTNKQIDRYILPSLFYFRTPLHEACQEGHAVVAKILLENAQNNLGEKFVNSMCEDRDDDGATPLLLVTFMCLSNELT